jgi:hypothetical protein
MFINNLDRIPVQDVVAQLEREPKLLVSPNTSLLIHSFLCLFCWLIGM